MLNEKKLKKALEEMNDANLVEIAKIANSWDGSFDFVEVYDLNELIATENPYRLISAIIHGDVINDVDPVRYNVYETLETVHQWELENNVRDREDDIVEWIMWKYDRDDYIHTSLSSYLDLNKLEEDEKV